MRKETHMGVHKLDIFQELEPAYLTKKNNKEVGVFVVDMDEYRERRKTLIAKQLMKDIDEARTDLNNKKTYSLDEVFEELGIE
jgi:predicted RNA-binding protein Jag